MLLHLFGCLHRCISDAWSHKLQIVPTYVHIHFISRMPESNAEAVVCTGVLTTAQLKHTSVNVI